MRRLFPLFIALAMLSGAGLAALAQGAPSDWHMNATIIEACTCPMFCQCYFNAEPAAPGGHGAHGGAAADHHYCRFNNAYKINKGHYGALKLDGTKFWLSGDLGGDFSQGKMDWAVLTFDKATPKDQRDAIQAIAKKLMPVTWNSFTTSEGEISWTAGKSESHALLDGGKTAEVKLQAAPTAMVKSEPVVIRNLTYWGAPRNDGFVLMPSVVQGYRAGPKAYESKGTNGFMITFDIDSKSAPSGQ